MLQSDQFRTGLVEILLLQISVFFSADYDKFPTYDLLDLPKISNQIKRYSNIRILDMIKKIGYAFLIVSYLSSSAYSNSTAKDQLF